MADLSQDEENVFRSPELPFVNTIPGGMFAGRSVIVSGMVQQGFASDAKRFAIDLCCGLLINGDHMDNKALHFNPRFEKSGGWFSGPGDEQLVINSYISNKWGAEERFSNPFEEGKPFQIRILALEKYFKIAVNGRHVCDYAHRVPVTNVKTISVSGNIRVDYLEFQPALGKNPDGNPVVVQPPKKEEKVINVDRPQVPFVFDLPERGFLPSQCVRFTITPLISGKRFSLNLYAKGECVFHFRVDLPNGKEKEAVVRNNTLDGKWQTEERNIGQFPFSKGITHDIVFHAFAKSTAVDVDGMPYVKFTYRAGTDPVEVDRITVEGDAVLVRFTHKTLIDAPSEE